LSDIQLGQLIYKITGDSSQLDKAIQGSEKKVTGFKKLLGTLGAVFAFKQVVDGFISIVKAGSNLAEAQNAVNVVFRESSDVIENYSKTAAKSVGLSAREFNQLASSTGSLFLTAGQSADVAAKQTINLTERAADLASVFNTDVKDALGALSAALRGESEPARRFAINISDIAIQQYALANGLITSKNEMTEAIKVQARYGLILQQSAQVQGDFENTSKGLANQQRILGATFEDIQAKVGGPLATTLAGTAAVIGDMADDFVRWSETTEGLETLNALSKTFALTMAIVAGALKAVGITAIYAFDLIYKPLKNLVMAFQQLGQGDFGGAFKSLSKIIIDPLNDTVKFVDSFKNTLFDTVLDSVKVFKKADEEVTKSSNKKTDKLIDNNKKLTESEEEAAKRRQELAAKQADEKAFNENLEHSLKLLDGQAEAAKILGQDFDLAAQKAELLANAFAEADASGFEETLKKIKIAMGELGDVTKKTEMTAKEAFDNMTDEALAVMTAIVSTLGQADAFLDAKLERDLARVDEETQAKLEAAGLQEETEIQRLENEIAAAEMKGDSVTANELKNELARTKILEDAEKKKAKLRYESELKAWKLGRATILLEGAIAQIRAVSAGLSFGPAAVVMVPLLSALSLAGTIFALAAHSQAKPQAPTFETGGFVPGNSFSGDRVDIRANSGEAVLTTDQQREFMDIANGNKNVGGNVVLQLVTQTGRELKKWIFEGTRDGTIKIDNSALVSVGI
jgi:hypothetical protein